MKPDKSMSRGERRAVHEANRAARLRAFVALRRGGVVDPAWVRWASHLPSRHMKRALARAGMAA